MTTAEISYPQVRMPTGRVAVTFLVAPCTHAQGMVSSVTKCRFVTDDVGGCVKIEEGFVLFFTATAAAADDDTHIIMLYYAF